MSFDFIGMYSTKSIWSVITDKAKTLINVNICLSLETNRTDKLQYYILMNNT